MGEARLLRRIQTTTDATRILSTTQRQTVLPTLLRTGLVRASSGTGFGSPPHDLTDVDDLT